MVHKIMKADRQISDDKFLVGGSLGFHDSVKHDFVDLSALQPKVSIER